MGGLLKTKLPRDVPGASVPPFCTTTVPVIVPLPISDALLRITRVLAKLWLPPPTRINEAGLEPLPTVKARPLLLVVLLVRRVPPLNSNLPCELVINKRSASICPELSTLVPCRISNVLKPLVVCNVPPSTMIRLSRELVLEPMKMCWRAKTAPPLVTTSRLPLPFSPTNRASPLAHNDPGSVTTASLLLLVAKVPISPLP